MDRRRFLGAAAGLAATALWPSWLENAFAGRDLAVDADPQSPGLAAAWRRARGLGKPLLVLVVPLDEGAKYTRGQAFGELINHGSDEALATLVLCEVACATMAEVRGLTNLGGDAEPLMVLLETEGERPRARMVDAQLPAGPAFGGKWSQDWQARQRADDEAIEQRIAALAELVRRAVLPDDAALERRANQARARLDPAEADVVERSALFGAGLELGLVDRAAALIALSAETGSPGRRPAFDALLAKAAAARLRDQPPPGAYWARSSGCGTTVEGQEDLSRMVACGMGHVPAKSQRFLYFYSQAGR